MRSAAINAADDIEDFESDDEADDEADDDEAAAAPSGDAAAERARFPHFVSLEAMRRDGIYHAVDYAAHLAQGAAAPQRAPKQPRRAGGAAAAKPAKKKGRGKGRQQPKNAWRVRGGRRVYFDATGKQLTGAAAMVAYRRANGGGS